MIDTTEESKEWIRRIRLAKYKSLSLKTDENSLKLMGEIEELLIKDGFTREQLQIELKNYVTNELPNKDELIKTKVEEIMYDLATTLEKTNTSYISTNDYPTYYWRIQEIVVMDEELSSELLVEAEKRANIEHTMIRSTDFQGNDRGNHTYYFSKKTTK